MGVRFLQLVQHFLSVLGLRETAGKQLDCLEHLGFELGVSDNGNGFLQDIVAKLVGDKALHNSVHSGHSVSRLEPEFSH